ncbi:L-2-amino-4-chloropent-4-enoate dechlorinase/desaturase BesB [Streptomyces griseocarneus]|uniref:L-2-amino-4-chloropent-4-enoate dechlorinase/desaturase BesB n=1 Tax=Streptomyces griseocarneus TaxID=51201 RepID=UPI00167CAFD3|nr:L-2-amino-4-chloropent-4-enoate dechlorinase/desaturase BesB [Streptomyces griseocarneus]MBZ6475787.1 PLP-dependent transferase [Streptomyces griseocarneus]GHG50789.1 cystathionine gamma-synthase [Streptomyces griseocarneus]
MTLEASGETGDIGPAFGLRHIAAGRPVPGSIHSVSVSIPDIAAVIGYESGDAATRSRISWGYPRFRTHPYVTQVAGLVAPGGTGTDESLVLTCSARAARAAAAYAGLSPGAAFEKQGLHGLRFPVEGPSAARVRAYVQHTGSHLSSREAEDVLLDAGLIDSRQAEATVDEAPAETVRAVLADAYGVRDTADVSLHTSGMNAVSAAIAAVSAIQRENGRRRWLQLGWIFFDTMSLLERRVIDVEHTTIGDPFDLAEIARVADAHAGELAGIIAEVPSNPSLHVPDIPALREIAARAGCALVVDATIATPYNVDVLPHADVVCESLTKYATGSADVLMGAVVVNPDSSFGADLRDELRRHGDEPYHRDAARVAARIRGYADRMDRVNSNALALAACLERHDRVVRGVSWAYDAGSHRNYRKVERRPDVPGGLLMVDLRVPIEQVYDRLAVAKGPSFGAEFTMVSPQIFIAHSDLLATPEGRATLRARGLHRDMLRISVGTEDPERIVETFEQALRPPE